MIFTTGAIQKRQTCDTRTNDLTLDTYTGHNMVREMNLYPLNVAHAPFYSSKQEKINMGQDGVLIWPMCG